jgi:hypothetical protein
MALLKNKIVKIRGDKVCHGCGRKFKSGSSLEYQAYAEDGKIYSTYWCEICLQYWSEYMENDEDISVGDLRSEDFEAWEAIRIRFEG